MHDKCYCKNIGPFEICNMCVKRRYLLNFRCVKMCFKEIPEKIEKYVVSLKQYFEREKQNVSLLFNSQKQYHKK